jgi:23S rRNA (uracil-5-)-methyltransferase RumA
MQERLLKRNQEIEIRITDLAFGGVGIGKIPTEKGEFAVFVQNTIPGQLVKAVVEKAQKRYAECRLMEVLQKSPDEVDLPFQPIPGAPYASWPIEKQIESKRKNVFDLFRKIGLVMDVESHFDEYILSPSVWHYRNKMEYAFSVIRFDLKEKNEYDDFGLGFKHRGTWWCVENLDNDSGLFDAEFETKLQEIRKWLIATGLPAWHPPKRTGFYRYLVVRKSFASGQLLINLVTSESHLGQFDTSAFANFMVQLLGPKLAGLLHTCNSNTGDRVDPLSGSTTLLYGMPKITESIHGLQFEISMNSFFQTNPKSAERLYAKVLEYAGINKADDGKVILDLFCGTGTITQLLAQQSKRKVIGVDIVDAAIEDARTSAEKNGVQNLDFHAADVGKFLLDFPEYKGNISCLVMDPPRAGIAPKTLRKVIALDVPEIVYVSCNPATQARDIVELRNAGYQIVKFSLVDQFPHTAHVESVVLFRK